MFRPNRIDGFQKLNKDTFLILMKQKLSKSMDIYFLYKQNGKNGLKNTHKHTLLKFISIDDKLYMYNQTHPHTEKSAFKSF
jgi:hypothetical protein